MKKAIISLFLIPFLLGASCSFWKKDNNTQEPVTNDTSTYVEEYKEGNLDYSEETSALGLKLPKNLKGDLRLGALQSSQYLSLPETMEGDLYLFSLTSAEGLKLPKTLNGSLYLNGLVSPKGLVLPETIEGDLDLSGLMSTEGLKLTNIKGVVYLRSLDVTLKSQLKEKYPNVTVF